MRECGSRKLLYEKRTASVFALRETAPSEIIRIRIVPSSLHSWFSRKGCRMSRLLILLTALGGFAAVQAAASEPFTIDLQVSSGKASKTAHVESAARDAKPKERPLLEVKAGDRITVHWKFSGADAKAKIEDVTVHFIALKEDKPNQPPPHKRAKGVVAESALIMDVGPKEP